MALKLILGLGNPEARYEMTRHNAGFMVAAKLAIKCGANFSFKSDMKSEICKTTLKGVGAAKATSSDIVIARPTTYMNLSGQASTAICRFYKIELEDMLVVHDDVSLPLGTMRFARGGGAGGQHGVESIIELTGNRNNFPRLKIGVGPDPGGALRASYVLSDIPDIDQELYFTVITKAIEAIQVWLSSGIQQAMNAYNGLDLRPPAPVKQEPDSLRQNQSPPPD